MSNLFGNQTGAIPPQNRPLTGPANAPATQATVAQPTTPLPGYPPAPMPTDQSTVQPGLARDPQLVAALSIYAMQLSSQNPVDVSSALAAMESFGPAYRNDIVAAVAQQIQPGAPAMRNIVLMDALVRHGGTEAADRLLPLLQDSDPHVRSEAGKAFGKLRGVAAPGVAAPGAPGAGPVNAGTPGAPQTAPGQLRPDLVHFLEDFNSWRTLGDAGVQLAQLPTADIVAVANAINNAPMMEDEKAYDLISSVLAKRVQEPGVLDAMRGLLNKPGLRTEFGAKAKMRAATAVLHFGNANDAPAVAKLMATDLFLPLAANKLLIDQVAQKPDFVNHPSMMPALIAAMSSDSQPKMLAAGNALSKVKNARARDAIGESPIFKTDMYGATKQKWAMDWLNQHPGPYSPLTIQYLQRIAKNKDKELAKKAQDLINKRG